VPKPSVAPPLAFRALVASDQAQLWEWLHVALWDPPPAGPRPRAVLQDPRVRIYAEAWGRPGDVGVVAQLEARDIGACWMRRLPPNVGLAHVDADTPQLGIALMPAWQHRGFGAPLMREALARAAAAGYRQVALTVHPANPAVRLYQRCGFVARGLRNGYHLMVAPLAASGD
jgi:ribosomal protein S18 acetylase RimI-like enzyme